MKLTAGIGAPSGLYSQSTGVISTFVRGASLRSFFPASTLLLFENVPMEKQKLGRLVARLDGSVEQLTELQFEAQLDALKAHRSEQKRDVKIAPVDPGKLPEKK